MKTSLVESDFLGMFEPGSPHAQSLVTVTADGVIIGYGHQSPKSFLPAALHLYRAEMEGEEEPRDAEIQHLWAIPSNYETSSCWEVATANIQANTPHAVAVTILDV